MKLMDLSTLQLVDHEAFLYVVPETWELGKGNDTEERM